VFDGGRHDAGLPETARLEPREIRSVEFCTPEQVAERCRDFTTRRVRAALAALDHGTTYLEPDDAYAE
jgi:hypothetical protein